MQRNAFIVAALCIAPCAQAAGDTDVQALREQMRQLEQRIQQIESQPAARHDHAASGSNAFNPAISLILGGTYSRLDEDPGTPATGFAMSPNDHGHTRSFSLGESELGIRANIDPMFSGVATFALKPDDGSSVENAYVQTTALGNGFNLKMGRFFSGIGYLNEQHAHSWDFTDQPLVYRTLWDNQLGDDGVQLKWLAPSDTFVELGAELSRGRSHPGTDRKNTNGAAATALFLHVGDDVGASHNWRAGVSYHQTRRVDASSDNVPDLPGTSGGVTNSFTGDSRTTGLDFVWKYAPDGNTTITNFKLQAEYFQRHQDGLLTYNSTTTDSYRVTQSGWYVQGVYQFMPRWRAGLRHDQLDSGRAEVGALNSGNVISDYHYIPTRESLMIDFSPSEFSRLRLQLAQDKSRAGVTDSQLFLQYIMSLGAHGAHRF